jgi:hypothetical protein
MSDFTGMWVITANFQSRCQRMVLRRGSPPFLSKQASVSPGEGSGQWSVQTEVVRQSSWLVRRTKHDGFNLSTVRHGIRAVTATTQFIGSPFLFALIHEIQTETLRSGINPMRAEPLPEGSTGNISQAPD